jgi:hypothetical protein
MNATELTQRLILGPRNIDRMGKEVKGLLRMMVGLIESLKDLPTKALQRSFDAETCRWEISLSAPPPSFVYSSRPREFMIVCRNLESLGQSLMRSVTYSTSTNDHISFEDVQNIYMGLPCLIEALIDIFGSYGLKKQWKPFLRASFVHFEQEE